MIDRRAFRARAEQYARDHDWSFSWEYDDLSVDDVSDHEVWCKVTEHHKTCPSTSKRTGHCEHLRECEHEVLWCALHIDGEVVESLSGIIDPSPSYRRVIEAELASEALYAIEQHERALWTRYDQAIERVVDA